MGSWKQGWSGPGEIPCESLCPKTGLFLAEICQAYSLAWSVTVAWACPEEFFSARSGKRTGAAITSNGESKYLRASRGTFLTVVRAGAEYWSGLAPELWKQIWKREFLSQNTHRNGKGVLYLFWLEDFFRLCGLILFTSSQFVQSKYYSGL